MEIVRDFYERLKAGDAAGALGLMAHDIEWTTMWHYKVNGLGIAVRFAYEYHDDSGHWFRAYGNENWQFDAEGLMRERFASINDVAIEEAERKFHWPLGRRPDGYPGLSDLGL